MTALNDNFNYGRLYFMVVLVTVAQHIIIKDKTVKKSSDLVQNESCHLIKTVKPSSHHSSKWSLRLLSLFRCLNWEAHKKQKRDQQTAMLKSFRRQTPHQILLKR